MTFLVRTFPVVPKSKFKLLESVGFSLAVTPDGGLVRNVSHDFGVQVGEEGPGVEPDTEVASTNGFHRSRASGL